MDTLPAGPGPAYRGGEPEGSLAPVERRLRLSMMSGVLALAVLVLAIKAVAWWLTGSRGLFSDAIESVANVVTGGFAVFTAWWAGRPPDASHPYGHGRLEEFSAGFEGLVLFLAGIGIVREALPHLVDPAPLVRLEDGIGLALVAGALNGVVGTALVLRGRRLGAPVLTGEGVHLLSDTLTTAGVVVGLVLVRATGMPWIDTLVALLVGAAILASGVRLLAAAGRRLLDRQEAPLIGRLAAALERRRRPERIEIHLLRARRTGAVVMVDFHLTLPRYWSLERVHEEQHELATELIEELGEPAEILVHPDPCTPALCSRCAVEPCPVRAAPATVRETWDPSRLVGHRAPDEPDACLMAQREASRRVSEARAGSRAARK
ncbi:MAG: cation diffusion facilitator family transporter [Acidobacteriota bacterium]